MSELNTRTDEAAIERERKAAADIAYILRALAEEDTGYPDDWPTCLFCDRPAMDGHLTCGRAQCNESAARDPRR